MNKGTAFIVIIAVCGVVGFLFGISAVWTDLMNLNSSSSENEIWFVFFILLLFVIFGVIAGMILGSLYLLGALPFFRGFLGLILRGMSWDFQIIAEIFGLYTKSKDEEETELTSEEK